MKQKTLQKSHYDIYGYPNNPVYEEVKEDHVIKFQAETKRGVVGLLKTMLDNMDCEHIAIFRVDSYQKLKEMK